MVCPEEVNFLTDVAGGGPQPFSGVGWSLLSSRIAMVLSDLKVFINTRF